MNAGDDFDGVQYDTFHAGPPVCSCGRMADYDGRRCCLCAPLEPGERVGDVFPVEISEETVRALLGKVRP